MREFKDFQHRCTNSSGRFWLSKHWELYFYL